jgi:hypothetical protein
MSEMTHMIINFSNGRFVVEIKNPNMTVTAVRRVDHGDWKTQSVRKEFMGMEEGESGELVTVWDNFYGRWCRVKIGDRFTDILPSDLSVTIKE